MLPRRYEVLKQQMQTQQGAWLSEEMMEQPQHMGGGGYEGMQLRENVRRRQRIIDRAIARRAGTIAPNLN